MRSTESAVLAPPARPSGALQRRELEVRVTRRTNSGTMRPAPIRVDRSIHLSPTMPIPDLDHLGVLPPGLHCCSLDEIQLRFGSFQGSDCRVRLHQDLVRYAAEARDTRMIRALVVDGSFVTSKAAPGDIDLVVALAGTFPPGGIAPFVYNAISKRRIKAMYPFDVVVVPDGGDAYRAAVEFFAQVKHQPGSTKGLLRVEL